MKGHLAQKDCSAALSSSRIFTAGIGTFALSIKHENQLGCRGFAGPVPPPLWIRVAVLGLLNYGGSLPYQTNQVNFWEGRDTRKFGLVSVKAIAPNPTNLGQWGESSGEKLSIRKC
jgi:hypothetical protein